MVGILALLQCLQPSLRATTLHQFSRVAFAMLVMSGRVTMLGISRWAGKGGSYRTVQRFFYTVIPWAVVFWLFFRQQLRQPGDVYLLAGDEVVVTKAGKRTVGLDRSFSSPDSIGARARSVVFHFIAGQYPSATFHSCGGRGGGA